MITPTHPRIQAFDLRWALIPLYRHGIGHKGFPQSVVAYIDQQLPIENTYALLQSVAVIFFLTILYDDMPHYYNIQEIVTLQSISNIF